MSDARQRKLKQLSMPIEIEGKEVEVSFIESTIENEPEIPEVVAVVLMRHKIVNVIGKITGRKYRFNGAGSIVKDVDIKDAESMVNSRLPSSCCGSVVFPQFQILGR